MYRLLFLPLALICAQLTACNQSSSAPPAPSSTPPSAGTGTDQQNGGTSGTGGSAPATGPASGALGDLLNANAATPGTIRSAQVTQLNSEINALEGLLGIYQGSNCPGYETQITGDQENDIPKVGGSGPQTLAGGLLTGVGDAAVGGFASGKFNSDAAITAYTTGAQAIGAGITAAVVQNQTDVGTAALVSQSQQELNSCNSEIVNLQTQIAQKQQQIDELNAQGTQ